MKRILQRLLAHRLLQFLALGAVIFALAPPVSRPGVLSVPPGVLEQLREVELRRSGAPLSAQTERALADRALQEELLYQEALRLGIDRADPLVRRRLVEKVVFLAEDVGGASRIPTEGEVQAFYDAHRDRYLSPLRISFRQAFASTEEEAEAMRPRALSRGLEAVGEAFPLPRQSSAESSPRLAQTFGPEFVAALEQAPIGVPVGPVRSRFGWHLVQLSERIPAHPAPLEEVVAMVRLDCLSQRKRDALTAWIAEASRRRGVEVTGSPYEPERVGSDFVPGAVAEGD